jgi:NAD(P)-dependent dehydrogenase (short-subunit alcohol dehydrogenase family)
MFSLTGKSCVVTGASRGLGRVLALAFADQGTDVVTSGTSTGSTRNPRAR